MCVGVCAHTRTQEPFNVLHSDCQESERENKDDVTLSVLLGRLEVK